jgi:hypothetical protein
MPTKTKTPRAPTPPRLYAILARKSAMAVVFRRGPSKQVQLISWDTDSHTFRAGQWFKGRIYERRCDLSPSGEKLIYFASSQKGPYMTWTAVSRPPFLTALALWPKGDCWGGGGLFKSEQIIQLNHGAYQTKLAEGFSIPNTINIEEPKGWAGHGEDAPIHPTRLMRDGWTLRQEPVEKENKYDPKKSKIWIEYPQNEIWSKSRGGWRIDMRILGIKEWTGAWYVIEHDIVDKDGNVVLSLGRSDWADWSRSGEILFAKNGCLFRIKTNKSALSKPEQLIDLTDQKFRQVEPTSTALQWKGVMRGGEVIR